MAISKIKLLRAGEWLQVMKILAAILFLYISVSRMLNWDLLKGFPGYRMSLPFQFFGSSSFILQLDINAINEAIALVLIPCAGLLLLTQCQYIRRKSFLLAFSPILGILVVTGLSRFWSVAPNITTSRFIFLLAGALGGLWMGLSFQTQSLRINLEIFSVAMIVGNLAVVLFKPEFNLGYDPVTGYYFSQWNGLFTWKMPAGMVMGASAVVFLFRLIEHKNDRWAMRIYGMVFFVLSLMMTYQSNSLTEIFAVASVLVLVVSFAIFLRWEQYIKPLHWWVICVLVVLGFLMIWFERSYILGVFGKTEQLTGRIPLWTSLIPYIKQRLLHGYGFGDAFWTNIEYYKPIWELFPNFLPIFAHNGYIEALLDTGMPGLFFWISFLGLMAFHSIRHLLRMRILSTAVFFSWVILVAVMNVGNNHFGSYETFTWLVLVSSYSRVVRDEMDQKTVHNPSGDRVFGNRLYDNVV